jgi:hypothetical protein
MNSSSSVDARQFSPSAYSALIEALRARGYEARGFTEADTTKRHLIVRHDVDFSLSAALLMAESERALGLSSTYFVLLRTEFYNPLSEEGLAALQRIHKLGHTIGLHFDAALYPADRLEQEAGRECAMLETALEHPICVVSFHRPTASLIGQADRLAGRINAYGGRFVREIGYCSDSRGAWRHGSPLDHPALTQGRALQLLVHPFWWTEPSLPPEERLQRFLAERAMFLDRELARHCMVHKARD